MFIDAKSRNISFRLRGFTLIEAVVTIAILAILVRIALPAYSTYRNKGYLSEAFALTHPYQKRVEEYCNMGKGNYNVFGVASGSTVTNPDGTTPVFSQYKALAGLTWTYPGSQYPYLTMQLSNLFPGSDGSSTSYLMLYMIDTGNCNITWVCQNYYAVGVNQVTASYLPKFCSANTYGA
jgi:prepilin-type N-terminal cleavage/methylation domain-containing protein